MTVQDPYNAAGSGDDGGRMMWFVLVGLITLLVVMILAMNRYDVESVDEGGVTSEQIAAGQTALAGVGCYSGEVDGAYGPQTEQAIRDFQAASGLAVDGIFGPDTLEALETAVAAGLTVCTETDTGGSGGDGSGGDGSGDDGSGDDGASADDGAATDDGGGDDSADGGEVERQAVLESASYGSKSFTITTWDCTGDPGDLVVVASNDAGENLNVNVDDNVGTMSVSGSSDAELNVNGEVSSVAKEPGSFAAGGNFTEPNFAGEAYTITGDC